MAKFISIDKMKKLREASKNGDVNAKKILTMQMDGTEDFSSLLDDYFKPHPEEHNNLGEKKPVPFAKKPIINEKVCEEPCFLDNLIKQAIQDITLYNTAMMELLNMDDNSSRKGMLVELEDIKKDRMEHLDKLKRLKGSLNKKNEEIID